jgi:hypothetical protein
MSPQSVYTVKVTAELEELTREQGWPKMAAYVFTRRGKLLGKGPLEPDPRKPTLGYAAVKVEAAQEQVVVKVGPDVEDVADLARYQLPLQPLALAAEPAVAVAIKIGKPIWGCWIKVPYLVAGTVEKMTGNGHLPICYGEVDVYDVDVRFCFLKLPDRIIELIRDGLIDVLVDPPRIVKPEELPFWDDDWVEGTPRPPFPPPLPDMEITQRLEKLPPEWAFARERFKALSTARPRMDAVLDRLTVAEKQAMLDREAVQGIRIREIVYTNTAQFRELLANRFLPFRYWLCWWPWIYWLWWPWCRWYSLEKLGTATLQADGSFSLKVWVSICRNDLPDLWFVVRQKIGATERVIYRRRPVPCHTYWNHKSGDPVVLHVTDPDAYACQETPPVDQTDQDLWIVPLAIGNYSLKQVYGTGAGKNPPVTPPGNNGEPDVGRYESVNFGLGANLDPFQRGPFAGWLGLRYLFSPALLPAGVKYYRIKYRVNGTSAWKPLTHPVVRHYSNWNTVTSSIEFPAYLLGPVPGTDYLYELQPDDPPNKLTYAWARWEVIDATVDLMAGYLDSTQMALDEFTRVNYGTVELKLELFDAAKNRINPAASGVYFRLPNNTDHWNTVTTVDPALVNTDLVAPDPEDPAYQTFIFRLVIDNRGPTANILEPVLSAGVVGSCGMLHPAPGASLTLRYEASHPAQYGQYRFDLYRGTPPSLRDGSSPPNATREGQAGLPGTVSTVGGSLQLVTDLLGPCPEAAFSENLYIWNMNWNGWSRVGPDASFVRAFGLTQPGP